MKLQLVAVQCHSERGHRPAFWRSRAAFWRHLVVFNVEPNLEVLVLVAVAVAHVPFKFVCGEKTLRASRELASAEKLGK